MFFQLDVDEDQTPNNDIQVSTATGDTTMQQLE